MGSAVVVCALVYATMRPAAADDYFGGQAPDEDIQFRMDKPRTDKQLVVIGSLMGGAAVFGGVGLGFHLRSRSLSNEISAVADHTGRIYDQTIDDKRSSAGVARTVSIVSYSIGGAFLIAGAVALYVTEPGTEVVTVGKERQPPPPPPPVSRLWLAPGPDGAVVGTGWRF